jgi:hypothetical protein
MSPVMKSSREGPASSTSLNLELDEEALGVGGVLAVVARPRMAPKERWNLATLHAEAIVRVHRGAG